MHRIVGIALVALVAFVVSVAGIALFLSPLVGGVAFLFWRLLDPDSRDRRGLEHVVVTATAGGVLGVAPALMLVGGTPGRDLLGVVIAAATAGACYYLAARRRVPLCVLCGGAAIDGVICPRSYDRVCMRPSCWNGRYVRCTRCHERGVVLFPMANERWWTTRLGPRVKTGECLSCYEEAREADLRECGQCHWPMCKRCWDHHNGSCVKCQWTMADLPKELAPFLRRTNAVRRPPANDESEGGNEPLRGRVAQRE